MFELGIAVEEQLKPITEYFHKFALSDMTLEEFTDFANKNEIEIIEIKSGEEISSWVSSYMKVKQFGLSYSITTLQSEDEYCLQTVMPLLELDVLCSLKNKKEYVNWITYIWYLFGERSNPNDHNKIYRYSGITVSQLSDKEYIFEQNKKKYIVKVVNRFDEHKLKEMYDLEDIKELKNEF